jgi:hypothetical protein
MGGQKNGKRIIGTLLTAEDFDRVCRAARKMEVTRSRYLALFVEGNIDVIDPEGATPQETE